LKKKKTGFGFGKTRVGNTTQTSSLKFSIDWMIGFRDMGG